MKKPLLLILLFLGLTTFNSYAGYLDDWTDEQLCGWMDSPSPPEYMVVEAKNRGLSCANNIASKTSTKTTGKSSQNLFDLDYKKGKLTVVPLYDYPEAKCNSGSAAEIILNINRNHNKWAVMLHGGSAAGSDGDYRKRAPRLKLSHLDRNDTTPTYPQNSIWGSLEKANYNLIFIPHCSSDMHSGDHYRTIDGKKVPFKGRKIVEAVVSILSNYIKPSDELIVAGFSAGAHGIGYNLDLFSEIKAKRTRYVFDGGWLTQDESDYIQNNTIGHWQSWYDYVLISVPKLGCKKLKPQACHASLQKLKKFGESEAFVTWNKSDWRFQKSDGVLFEKEITADLKAVGGGISVGPEYGTVSWTKNGHGGHVILFNKYVYAVTKKGLNPKKVFEAWLHDKKGSIYIDLFDKQKQKHRVATPEEASIEKEVEDEIAAFEAELAAELGQ